MSLHEILDVEDADEDPLPSLPRSKAAHTTTQDAPACILYRTKL